MENQFWNILIQSGPWVCVFNIFSTGGILGCGKEARLGPNIKNAPHKQSIKPQTKHVHAFSYKASWFFIKKKQTRGYLT